MEVDRDDERERDKDDTPDAWIISHNLHRRHLNDGQRKMAASDYADHLRKQRREAQVSESNEDDSSANLQGEVVALAAEAFNVPTRGVYEADKIKRDGAPALVAEVRKGKVPVSSAAKTTKAPKTEQTKAVAKGKRGVTALATDVPTSPASRSPPAFAA